MLDLVLLSGLVISVAGEMLSEIALKVMPIATIERVASLVWRLLFDLMISVLSAVLSDRAVSETPVASIESVAIWSSDLRDW